MADQYRWVSLVTWISFLVSGERGDYFILWWDYLWYLIFYLFGTLRDRVFHFYRFFWALWILLDRGVYLSDHFRESHYRISHLFLSLLYLVSLREHNLCMPIQVIFLFSHLAIKRTLSLPLEAKHSIMHLFHFILNPSTSTRSIRWCCMCWKWGVTMFLLNRGTGMQAGLSEL